MKTFISIAVPTIFSISFLTVGLIAEAQPRNYTRLSGVDLNRYCRSRWPNSSPGLVEQTAWGWRCVVGSARYPISVQEACKEQNPTYPVVQAIPTNPRDPYSWGCFIPTVGLPR